MDAAATGSNAKNHATTGWLALLLFLAVWAAYAPVVNYAFTDYDDRDYVWNNPPVLHGVTGAGVVWAFTHFYDQNWHPVTWLSHMVDVQLFGLNAGGHHATSVLCHAANTVLLFLWLSRLTGFRWRSALVAALFGLHPLHVESVAWVAERKDVLSTFFLLLTLMAYGQYADGRIAQSSPRLSPTAYRPSPISHLLTPICYFLSLFLFALGLMSKPMLVTLPFLLLLLDYWPLQRFQISGFKFQVWKSLLVEKIPFFALSLASCVVTFWAQLTGKAMMAVTVLPVAARFENALVSYALYLGKMFWPVNLAAFYPLYYPNDTDEAIVAAAVLLLVSAGVVFFRRQRPWLVTGWLWYLGTLVPVIGLFQIGGQALADRYTYVPLIGVFIALVWLAADLSARWPGRRWILTLLSVAVLAASFRLTVAQVGYWQNSETLARHALAVTSQNAPMEVLLGNVLLGQGKSEEAAGHFTEAVKIWPKMVASQYDLALALVQQHKLAEAVAVCQTVLQLQPDHVKTHNLLENLYLMSGKWPEAVAENRALLQLQPKNLSAMNNLAWLLATAPDDPVRDGPEAVRMAEQACQLSKYQVTAYVGTLAAAYAEAGRFDEAVSTAQKAVGLAEAAGMDGLVEKNRRLLELYRQKKAWHEPAGH